jgi:NarL family two-component system response regulator LiaR
MKIEWPVVSAGRCAAHGAIRVLIADDHAVVRRGICALLVTEPDIEVVGATRDGCETVAETHRLRPDVVLMDLAMPLMDGLEATRYIVASLRQVRILVLACFTDDDKLFPAIQAGAQGYLLKDAGPEELVQAIHQVCRGEYFLHPTIARKLLDELFYPLESGKGSNPLAERELQVLRLVAQGLSDREIAERLTINEAMVRTHANDILSKCRLRSPTQRGPQAPWGEAPRERAELPHGTHVLMAA